MSGHQKCPPIASALAVSIHDMAGGLLISGIQVPLPINHNPFPNSVVATQHLVPDGQ